MARQQLGTSPTRPTDATDVGWVLAELSRRVMAVDASGATISVTLWIGTAAEYALIGVKDPFTLYFVTA